MKKAFALLILFLLCIPFTNAYANSQIELMFQEIPWYSTPGEAMQCLYQKGFLNENDESIKRMLESIDKIFLGSRPSYLETNNKDEEFPYAYNTNRNNAISPNLNRLSLRKSGIIKTIAKHEIFEIALSFWNDQGTFKLVECAISFETDDLESTSLFDALSKAYGKPAITKGKTDKALWYGDKNTIVLKSYNYVIYATMDGLNLSIANLPPEPEKEDTDF